jgi:uroporphyrinogen-III synthase
LDEHRPPCDLAGLSVLVSRPAHQSERLCDMIESARGRPVRFPALEIRGPADKHAARATLAGAVHADLLIFVSANAVQYAFPLLPDQLPLDIDIAAVGGTTAEALRNTGLDPTLVPERMDSEGLLALPQLQAVQGKTVYILRGNGGRELIRDTLMERGAEVHQVEVYRRQIPQHPAGVPNLLRHWSRLAQVVIASSNAVLDNLFALLGDEGSALLRGTPLVVVSRRMAQHAAERGCERVHVANSARDADVVAALCAVKAAAQDP